MCPGETDTEQITTLERRGPDALTPHSCLPAPPLAGDKERQVPGSLPPTLLVTHYPRCSAPPMSSTSLANLFFGLPHSLEPREDNDIPFLNTKKFRKALAGLALWLERQPED